MFICFITQKPFILSFGMNINSYSKCKPFSNYSNRSVLLSAPPTKAHML